MGLLDKLRGVVDVAKESINNVIGGEKESKNPLEDDVVRKYYEVIFGMDKVIGPRWKYSSKREMIVSAYFKRQLNENVDRDKMLKAIELFKLSYENRSEESHLLDEYNKKLKTENLYVDENFDVYDACFQEETEIIKSEYNSILEVIKDNPSVSIFYEGVSKNILKKYSDTIERYDLIELLRKTIMNSFIDANEVTQKIVLEYLYDIYHNRIHNNKYDFVRPKDAVVLMALKAIHFNKYGDKREGYVSISDEDCRDVILKYEYYNSVLKKHPFDQEEYITKFIDDIKCVVFRQDYSSYSYEFMTLNVKDDYFCDAVCNIAWKEISKTNNWTRDGEDISASTKFEDVFDILWTYFS